MLKELEALRNKQKKHDEEMEDLRKAHQNAATLEVPEAAAASPDEDQRYSSSGRKASTIEEFTVSELIA